MNYDSLSLTSEEINSLNNYQGLLHKKINCLLNDSIESELSFIFNKANYFQYFENSNDLLNIINECKLIYSAMIKTSIKKPIQYKELYRGTTVENIFNNEQSFLSTTTDYNMAENYFSNITDQNKACALLKINQNIPYYDFVNSNNYGNNFEKEVLLSPFLKFEIETDLDKDNIKYYIISLKKEDFKTSDVSLEQIINSVEDATNSLKQLVSNLKLVKQKEEQYNILNDGMHNGIYNRTDYKTIRLQMNDIIEEINKIKNENENLKQKYIEFKNKFRLYIKNEFLNLENNINLEYNNEVAKKERFLIEEKNKLDIIEKNNLINSINQELEFFIKELYNYQKQVEYLNTISKKYDVETIKFNVGNYIDFVNIFKNNIKSLDLNTLNKIFITLKSYDFLKFFSELKDKDNYNLCLNIKEKISNIYKKQKLQDINNQLSLLEKKKNILLVILNKIIGKEKKENEKKLKLIYIKNTLIENKIYDLDFIQSNLTSNETINNQLMEDINFLNQIYKKQNPSNINIDNIAKIFDIKNYKPILSNKEEKQDNVIKRK